MDALSALTSEFGTWTLVAIAAAALVTSTIHGAVGVAGGFLMTAALSLMIGVRPVVPVMSIALVISHGARSLMNVADFDRRVFLAIMLPAFPMIFLGGIIYAVLPVNWVALMLGLIILGSIPLRRWAGPARSRRARARWSARGPPTAASRGPPSGRRCCCHRSCSAPASPRKPSWRPMAVISLATQHHPHHGLRQRPTC